MTELSFLIDLLLNHKLPKITREAVASRLRDVETKLSGQGIARPPPMAAPIPPHLAGQAPSTIAAMMRHGDTGIPIQRPDAAIVTNTVEFRGVQSEPPPVAVIAQTPQAAAALAQREQMIAQAMSGRPEPGMRSPRKR